MTTTEKLRDALQAVEPGWTVPDTNTLRRRAHRVRLKRRIASAVAVAAAVTTVVTVVPHVAPRADDRSTAASLSQRRPVPTTVREARTVALLTVRSGPLPRVRIVGTTLTVPGTKDVSVRVMPPATGSGVAGQFCTIGAKNGCSALRRSADGWAAPGGEGVAGDFESRTAAMYWVVEAPVASVVASVDGAQALADISDLGQGYQLVSVQMPVEPRGSDELAIPEPDSVWAFSPRGELVARYPG